MTWQAVLTHPENGSHIAQLYQSDLFLYRSVGIYLAAGLQKGDAAVLVATPGHTTAFLQDLTAKGFDVNGLKRSGQLTVLDAEATLSEFSIDGEPDRKHFIEVVGGVIEKAGKGYPRVRAFGEMVNLLWQRGELSKAIALEELWNDLAKIHSFSLFCAYVMDNFNPKMHEGPLQSVCKTHSHLIPAEDYGLLEKSVSEAIGTVLGSMQASMLFSLVAAQRIEQESVAMMPSAQHALLWLKKNMPITADKVLLKSRSYYQSRLEKTKNHAA